MKGRTKKERDEGGGTLHDRIKVYGRLRPTLPEDEEYSDDDADDGALSGGAFATGGAATPTSAPSCFPAFDQRTGECTYHRPASLGGDGAPPRGFKFDGCFGDEASQADIYESAAAPIVDGVMRGYNGTILAYGQTGSGKTHTMRGDDDDADPVRASRVAEGKAGDDDDDAGVIPRALGRIFAEKARLEAAGAADVSVSVSYLQIYCEIVHDLLEPQATNLSIREGADGEVFVEGLSKVTNGDSYGAGWSSAIRRPKGGGSCQQ